MQCGGVQSQPGVTALSFVCGNNPNSGPVLQGGGVASILRDGGAATLSTGSFLMQPGTYQVEVSAEVVQGCGTLVLTVDNTQVYQLFNSPVFQCGPTVSTGIVAGAAILQFGPNQTLQFVPSSSAVSTNSPVPIFPNTLLIFTKLQ
jgi:hypothetical protein